MPKVNIPNRICKHCGDTIWYVAPKTNQFVCYKKLMECTRRYHKTEKGKISLEKARAKERKNLTDNYIRQNIYVVVVRTTGNTIDRGSISKEHINKYRENLKFQRNQKLTSYGNKELKHEKAERNRRNSI